MIKLKLSDFKFVNILIAGVTVIVTKICLIALIVMVHAIKSGFEVRGTPDQNKISGFAATVGQNYGPIMVIILTFFGAYWVARKANVFQISNGVAVSLIVAVVNFILYPYFSFTSLGVLILILIAGWLGGLIGRRGNPTVQERSAASESDRP